MIGMGMPISHSTTERMSRTPTVMRREMPFKHSSSRCISRLGDCENGAFLQVLCRTGTSVDAIGSSLRFRSLLNGIGKSGRSGTP